jgi:hypothetical protein
MPPIANYVRSLMAVMMAAWLLIAPAHAATKSWLMSEASGQVVVENGQESRMAARGMTLQPGDVVATGASGRAIIVRGGEYIMISPKSRIRITKPQETGAITQIFQQFGSALFKIEKKETPHFGVKTPYLAAVVKGTTFTVTVTDTGATLQVTEGRVEVSTLDGGASDMIVPGRIARIDGNDKNLLKVLGDGEREIRSPLPVSASDEVVPGEQPFTPEVQSPDAHEPWSDDMVIEDNGSGGGADIGFSGSITSSLVSQPVNLAALTGGLIASSQPIDRLLDRGTGNGNAPLAGNGNAGGNGNGNAPGADNGNAGGNGNGNALGVGNGNAGGSGNGDALGAGNGNAGGSGNALGGGNGNAGDNGNGNALGGGSGNGNALGVGNGNAGGSGNGNALGVGNGNAGGNGNGNAPGVGNGNAGGNGNGNALGVGNGNAGGNGNGGGRPPS